jgi:pseudaminic acid synthase
MNDININGRKIGPDNAPYVIAEVSANHNGKYETALRLIEETKKCGAYAVKLQTYRPDTITLNSHQDEFKIKGGLWDGRSLYELYKEAHMPWEWHKPLFDRAHHLDITIFSSPFDFTAIDLLESLNAPAYKFASFAAVDLPLIEYAARTGMPMIISTGIANDEEIAEAITAARQGGCEQIAILHCVSAYPARAADYNLRTIQDMCARFGVVVGLSDHTLDNTTAVTSIALGASLIEKHFTLARLVGRLDNSLSLEPPDLAALCGSARTAWEALGRADYGLQSSEQGNAQFRRSLYFVKDMKARDVISLENVRSVRPSFGLAPKLLTQILGKKVRPDVIANTAVLQEQILP